MSFTTTIGSDDIVARNPYMPITASAVLSEQFAVRSQKANELILAKHTAPYGEDETIRFAVKDVKDVYKNLTMSRDNVSDVSGKSAMVGNNMIIKRVTTETGEVKLTPIHVRIVCETANDADIDDEMLDFVVVRTAQLCTAGRLKRLLSGNIASIPTAPVPEHPTV